MRYPDPYIKVFIEGSSSLFSGLNQIDKEAIELNHTVTVIKKGEYLFKEGSKTKGLVCLVAGKAKVFRVGVGRREHIIRMLKDHDLIGFQSLFTENKWTVSSMAVEESIICTIEKHCLLKILRNNADLSIKFNKILSEELTYSYNKMISISQKHVRGRLSESLLMLADIYGYESDGCTINAALPRNDIAHLSNMTTSNAIRTLSNLASEGNIRVKGKKISLLNIPNLMLISEQA
jgi:CRP/FNR family transcriptional regulator, polysaccharide utilization system transcription regulator